MNDFTPIEGEPDSDFVARYEDFARRGGSITSHEKRLLQVVRAERMRMRNLLTELKAIIDLETIPVRPRASRVDFTPISPGHLVQGIDT